MKHYITYVEPEMEMMDFEKEGILTDTQIGGSGTNTGEEVKDATGVEDILNGL